MALHGHGPLPPGLAGWVAAEQLRGQKQNQQLGALQALMQMENARIQQQRAAELHPLQLDVLRRQAQAQDVKFAPAGSVPFTGGVRGEQIPFKPEGPQSDVGKLRADLKAGTITPQEFGAKFRLLTTREAPAAQQAIDRLVQGGLSNDVAANIVHGRYAVSRDPISGTAQIIDKATGKRVGGEQPAPIPQPAPLPRPGTAISPTISGEAATGPSGFYGNIANTIAGAVGTDAPYPRVEAGIQALTNLKVQTKAMLQESIPGRPSVYLLQELDRLAVTPASLFQGDDRSMSRLKQTRDMLKTEVSRLERDILSKPDQYRPDEISKTRANHSQLSGVLREYDAVIENFNRRQPQAQEGQGGISRSGRLIIFRNGRWEYR